MTRKGNKWKLVLSFLYREEYNWMGEDKLIFARHIDYIHMML